MRQPCDIESELSALAEPAKLLKEKRVRQLGELVAATVADSLAVEVLAGALLAVGDANDDEREAWRVRGAAFFQDSGRAADRARPKRGANAARASGAQPIGGDEGAA